MKGMSDNRGNHIGGIAPAASCLIRPGHQYISHTQEIALTVEWALVGLAGTAYHHSHGGSSVHQKWDAATIEWQRSIGSIQGGGFGCARCLSHRRGAFGWCGTGAGHDILL